MNGLLKFHKEYQQFLDNVKLNINSKIQPAALEISEKMNSGQYPVIDLPDHIEKMMNSSVKFYKNSDFSSAKNCKNIKLQLNEFIDTACLSFVKKTGDQSLLILRLSPLLLLLNCVIFLTLLGTRPKENELKADNGKLEKAKRSIDYSPSISNTNNDEGKEDLESDFKSNKVDVFSLKMKNERSEGKLEEGLPDQKKLEGNLEVEVKDFGI